MTVVAHITMLTWPFVVVAFFAWLPARRAVITAFLAGWLFLPVASYPLPGLPDYTKMSATCFGIFLAAAVLDPRRLAAFRPSWGDIPVVVLCLCPLASSLSNGLGFYDGLSSVFGTTVTWGMPYLVGRLYFRTREDLRELAIGVFVGGLAYVPFCLLEIRMSPQLHNIVYGFHQHSFGQTVRFGGWRPTVFMQHGLMVGAWMMLSSLSGVWLCWTGALGRVKSLPAWPAVLMLLCVTVLCKSTGALLLLLVGLAVLAATDVLRTRAFLVSLLIASPCYLLSRATGAWDVSEPIAAALVVSKERAESLRFRVNNEDILADKARERWLFGWGGWGRNRVYDDYGNDVSVTDGLWIIEYGTHGVIGLAALYGLVLSPCALVIARSPASKITSRQYAPVAITVSGLSLYAVDCLMNAMVNPTMVLAAGALVSTSATSCVASPLQVREEDGRKAIASMPRSLWPPAETPKRKVCHA